MSAACHLERVALYSRGAAPAEAIAQQSAESAAPPIEPYVGTVVAAEVCEYCDAPTLSWRKCKQICTSCGQINRSCADL